MAIAGATSVSRFTSKSWRAFSGGRPSINPAPKVKPTRSEEHTSELQSQSNLVCRLLLEKKNNGQPAPASLVRLELLRFNGVVVFFSGYGGRRDLHSFPTRRSSDLLMGAGRGGTERNGHRRGHVGEQVHEQELARVQRRAPVDQSRAQGKAN